MTGVQSKMWTPVVIGRAALGVFATVVLSTTIVTVCVTAVLLGNAGAVSWHEIGETLVVAVVVFCLIAVALTPPAVLVATPVYCIVFHICRAKRVPRSRSSAIAAFSAIAPAAGGAAGCAHLLLQPGSGLPVFIAGIATVSGCIFGVPLAWRNPPGVTA